MIAIKCLSLRLQTVFVMMEESTFDKSGIERHEIASEFLTLTSFQLICDIETGLRGKNEAGVNPLPMTSTFSQH